MRLQFLRHTNMEVMMRKFLKLGGVFYLGFLFSSSAHALISFGLKGGINLNTYSAKQGGTALNDYTYGLGYMGGLSMETGLGPISVGLDALFAKRNIAIKSTVPSVGGGKVELTTLHIPVLAKFSLMPLMNLQAGGYYSHPLDKIKVSNASGTTSSKSDGKSDYGIVAGLGVSLAILSIEARYNFGLKNQSDDPKNSKSRAIDILLGFMF